MRRLPRPTSRLAGICAVAVALVLLRSAVWVFWEHSFFDSDQAVTGLMAKHLAELRAFPLMFYGQPYMLGVESWLVAPVFKVFGVSVLTLRLPLVAINIVFAVLLLRILVKDARVPPAGALIASLFFLVAPPVTASRLVEASSGSIEPFVYVLLLWMTRGHPVAFGVVGGIGFFNREFTAYGIAAIVILEVWHGTIFTKASIERNVIAFGEMLGIALVVRILMGRADLIGPGTAGTLPPEVLSSQPAFWLSRFCWNPAALASNLWWLVQENLGTLFGWHVGPLSDYVRSGLTIGHAWIALVPVALALTAVIAAIAGRTPRDEHARTGRSDDNDFPAYLMLVGLQAVVVYAFLTCNVQDRMLVRYTLLALLMPIGLVAWLQQAGRPRLVKAVAMATVLVWAAASLADHVTLLAEYLHRPPRNDYRDFANLLEREGVRYGRAPYWTAYQIDFLTNERVVLGSYDKVRVSQYEDIVGRHENESIAVVFDDPCRERSDLAFERWCISYLDRARHPRP